MAREIKKCGLCGKKIKEDFEKLKGSLIKIKEGNKNHFIYVCSDCQKTEDWMNNAIIKCA